MLYAKQILKPDTISAAEKLGPVASQILDRWVLGWKKETKALESSGELLPKLKEQAEKESQIYADANQGGSNSHLARHEIMAMHEVSPGPP